VLAVTSGPNIGARLQTFETFSFRNRSRTRAIMIGDVADGDETEIAMQRGRSIRTRRSPPNRPRDRGPRQQHDHVVFAPRAPARAAVFGPACPPFEM